MTATLTDARFPRGFPDGMVPGEFPPCGMRPDFPMGLPMRRFPADMPMNSGGGFSDGMPIPRNNGAGRPFPGGMSMRMPGDDMGMKMRDGDMDLRRFPDNRPMGMGGDSFGMGPNPGRRFPDDFSGGQLGGSNDRMMPGMQKGPEGNSLPDTLLKYLVCFFQHTSEVHFLHKKRAWHCEAFNVCLIRRIPSALRMKMMLRSC